jgi:hypothetical protein
LILLARRHPTSLLKPLPGIVIDRISVLLLKIEAYKKAGRNTEAMSAEKMELESYLKNYRCLEPPRELVLALQVVNHKLWCCEDLVRAPCNSQNPANLGGLAREIAALNDTRSSLIRRLDAAYGCDIPTEEKIYENRG